MKEHPGKTFWLFSICSSGECWRALQEVHFQRCGRSHWRPGFFPLVQSFQFNLALRWKKGSPSTAWTSWPLLQPPQNGSSSANASSQALQCSSGSAPSSASSPTASRPAPSRSPRMTTSTSGSSWQPLSLWQVRDSENKNILMNFFASRILLKRNFRFF